MKEIPPEFLQEIAEYCELTEKQTEAFIKFYSTNQSKEEIAQDLKISVNALYQRLIRVCENIGNRGNTYEIEELRNILWEKYRYKDKRCIYYLYKLKKIQIAKEQNSKILDLSNVEKPGYEINKKKKLDKIPDEVFSLTNLSRLFLNRNEITKIPQSISNLINLSVLTLSNNKLTELPDYIDSLINLSVLDLSNNKLTELPESLGDLVNLFYLDLGKNGSSAKNTLYDIFFSGNTIQEIPESIGKLVNLSQLNLSNNEIKRLPKSISNLTNLSYLNLGENPLESPPLEIANQGIEAIREYFRQLEEEGLDYIYEAKLLIVGEAGAGKTTLANKIQDVDYQLPEESDSTSTEGIDVVKWKFKIDEEREFCINIWDFGGQEIYHATHQFFLTKRSLYTLVADSRKEDTDFYYWLNVVELLSENSPLLIIKNEKVDRKRDINEKALRGQFTNLKEILSSNLKTNRGLDTIVSNIKHYIQYLPHIGQALPKTWIKVRQALEKDPRNHITLKEYLNICQENGFSLHKDKLQLSGYLHDLGVCLHFQDKEDSLLYKTVILKPEWGTQAVYTVLDNDKVRNNQGYFTREDLKLIWDDEEYVEMRGELLELMKKFQLCYEIPSQKDTFIAPQLLSENQPDYEWNENDNLTLRYSYPDFMPKGIITRYIVAMHQYIDEQKNVWKTGVILNKGKTKAEVIEYYGKRLIEIRVSGTNKRDLMTIVIHEIDKINDSFKRLKYLKLIPCNCKQCIGENQKPFLYDFNRLIERLNYGKDTIECGNPPYNEVNVLNLVDRTINRQRFPTQDNLDCNPIIKTDKNSKINIQVIEHQENVQQSHSGNGDNVGRNKNITN